MLRIRSVRWISTFIRSGRTTWWPPRLIGSSAPKLAEKHSQAASECEQREPESTQSDHLYQERGKEKEKWRNEALESQKLLDVKDPNYALVYYPVHLPVYDSQTGWNSSHFTVSMDKDAVHFLLRFSQLFRHVHFPVTLHQHFAHCRLLAIPALMQLAKHTWQVKYENRHIQNKGRWVEWGQTR